MLQIDNAIATDPDSDPALNKRHFTIAATDYVIRVLMLDLLRDLSRSAMSTPRCIGCAKR